MKKLGFGWFGQMNRRIDKADFWLFEFSVWLHVIARTLVEVFIPLILLSAGFSIKEVIIYYLIFHGIDIPLNFIVPPLVRRYGARIIFALSSIFAIGFFGLLGTVVPTDWITILALAFLGAMYDVLYWNTHLFLFIQTNKLNPKTDHNTAVLFSVKSVAMIVGPALGAFVLIYAGEQALLMVSVIIFILSLIPLIRVDDFSDKPVGIAWKFRQLFAKKADRSNYISLMLYSIHRAVEFTIWPLFIFVTFNSIQSVALVPIIISATAIIFTVFFSGKTAKFRREMIITGSVFLAFVWVFRIFFQTEILVYVSIFLVGFFMILVSIPLHSDIFDRALETDPMSAVVYRNVASMTGRFFLFAVLAVLVNVFNMSFLFASFSLIVLAGFNGFLLLSRKREEVDLGIKQNRFGLEEH